jgi:LPXTG-motif cell wall-anchored protein
MKDILYVLIGYALGVVILILQKIEVNMSYIIAIIGGLSVGVIFLIFYKKRREEKYKKLYKDMLDKYFR